MSMTREQMNSITDFVDPPDVHAHDGSNVSKEEKYG